MSDSIQDSSHYYRIISLVVDVGTQTLLDTFYDKIPQANVSGFFSSTASITKFNELKKIKVLSQPQYDLVTSSNPDPSQYDISLLTILLRNVCPSVDPPQKGWKTKPTDPNDATLGAELLRFREIRNSITAHGATAQIDSKKFKALWKTIKGILLRIAGKINTTYEEEVKDKISDLKTRHLDPQGEREQHMLTTFRKWQQEETESLKEILKGEMSSLQQSLESLHLKVDCGGKDTVDAARQQATYEAIGGLQQQVSKIDEGLKNITATQEYVRQISDNVKSTEGGQGQILSKMEEFEKQIEEIKKCLAVLVKGQQAPQSPRNTNEVLYQRCPTLNPGIQGNVQPMSQYYAQPMSGQAQQVGLQPMSQYHAQPMSGQLQQVGGQPVSMNPAAPNPLAIHDRDLHDISKKIGMEWEEVGVYLDYDTRQIEQLKMLYPYQVQGRIFNMLKKWHDVVVQCNENPRMLLAGVFVALRNKQLALHIAGTADQLDAAGTYRSQNTTVGYIQNIIFDPPHPVIHQSYSTGNVSQGTGNPGASGPLYHGAPGAFNVFGGNVNIVGSMTLDSSGVHHSVSSGVHHSFSLPASSSATSVGAPAAMNIFGGNVNTAPSSHMIMVGQQGPNVVQPLVTSQCRGEMMDTTDGATKPLGGHPLKKPLNDNLTQSVVNSLSAHMVSVGALISDSGTGTVFRVGSKYVMTAWHVVTNIIDPSRSNNCDYSKLEDESVFVNFNENPWQQAARVYRVKRIPAFKDESLDVVVLEIANPANMPSPLVLCNTNIEQMGLSDMSFIGYGTPQCQKKNLDPRCQIVSRYSNDIPAAHAWLQQNHTFYRNKLQSNGKNPGLVDSAYSGYDNQSKIIFNCHMEQGASGSPALTTKDPRSLMVVGVLTDGLPDFYFELPPDVQAQFPKQYRFEMGARMEYVCTSMRNSNPVLAHELFGSQS